MCHPMKQRFLPDTKGSAVGCSLDIKEEVCRSSNDVCGETVLSMQSGAFCGSVCFLSDISVPQENGVMLLCPGCCVSILISSEKPGAADLISEEMFAWMSFFEVTVATKKNNYRLS